MINRIQSLVATFGILVTLSGPVMAATAQVGTCKSGVASFSTIQSAVNASPVGATILICPGRYSEQVIIDKGLTIKGVASKNLGEATIVSPPGGLAQNTTSLATGNPIAAQILVTDTTGVSISNLTIDGSNNGINACSPNLIGIYYRNASGAVSHVVASNQSLAGPDTGCQSGLGIFVQSGNGGTSRVIVADSHVQHYQKNGITGNELGTNLVVLGNTVIGQGPTNGAAENSIQIGFGAKGKVISNLAMDDIWAPDTISDSGDAASGILVFSSTDVFVSGNTVSNTQFGIAFVSDPVAGSADNGTITSNSVSATQIFDGIDLCSNSNRVHRNIVNGSAESAIHLDSSCGNVMNNQISDNTANGACAGILVGTTAGHNGIDDNTFFNVRNTILLGDQCLAVPAALASSSAATKHPKSSAARP